MNTEQTLLPCPFCGSVARIHEDKFGFSTEYGVMCDECQAITSTFLQPKQAIEVWNRRAGQQEPALSDEEIIVIRKATKSATLEPWSDSIAFARAILSSHNNNGGNSEHSC